MEYVIAWVETSILASTRGGLARTTIAASTETFLATSVETSVAASPGAGLARTSIETSIVVALAETFVVGPSRISSVGTSVATSTIEALA